ncbi:hypothetical protein FKM82_008325 [Ascaphus truei]
MDKSLEKGKSDPNLLIMKHSLFLSFVCVILALLPHEVTAVELSLNNNAESFMLTSDTADYLGLLCAVHNHTREERLNWYRGIQPLDLRSGKNLNSSQVCISPLTPTDNGVTFTCLLESNTTMKVSVILNIKFPPILSGESSVTVEEEKSTQLTCGIQANPQAEMSWQKNGSTVIMEKSRYQQYLTSDTFQLTISKAQKSDAGTYTCVAVSSMGNQRRDFQLVVEDKKDAIPIEAISAAAVVGALTLLFGVFARRDKIFKKCMKKRDETSL